MTERSYDRPQTEQCDWLNRIPRIVIVAACTWVAVVASLTLAGWWADRGSMVRFATSARASDMMPVTAVGLLLCAEALWLSRDEQVARKRRWLACLLASLPAFLGLVFLWEYGTASDLGIDLLLFPRAAKGLVETFPGRPSVISSAAFVGFAIMLLCLDARSPLLRKFADLLNLTITSVVLVRLTSLIFGEAGVFAPRWTIFGEPLLSPMAPKTASCFLALATGVMFSRPARGLVSLVLARGPAGTLARWLLPAAIVLPILFGGLGILAIRAELQGADYPLSLVVVAMIVLLVLVISLNTRTILRVDRERSQRERLLRAVFDNAGAGLALVDGRGRPLVTNSTLQTMFGYSEDELVHLPFTTFSHPDDATRDKKLFEAILAGEKNAYSLEKRYLRKDGTEFWGQLNVSIARGDQQQPEFLVGMVQDITERKEAEEALARFKAVLDATPDFVGMADAKSRAIYVNRAGRAMTGIGTDITGITIPDFHPSEVAKWVMAEAVPDALRDGVWTGETELLGANGEHIPVSQVIIAHPSPDAEHAYFSTIMRDITEHKQFEESQRFLLDASRAFSGSLEIDAVLRSIAELTVPSHADYCGVYLVGEDGRIARKIVARAGAPARAVGNVRELPAGKQPDPVIAEVLKRGEPILLTDVTDESLEKMVRGRHLRLLRKAAPCSVMYLPLRTRQGVSGVIYVRRHPPGHRYDTHDFSLAKEFAGRAALALDNAHLFQQSQAATRLRDEVLRVVAHDLRNPLNTISLSAGLLRDLPRSDPQVWEKQLEVIIRSVAYADRLIQDLLDVARVQAGKLTMDRTAINPGKLLRQTIDLLQPAAAQKRIELRTEMPEHLATINADRHRLEQVLANIIGNAIKFSPEGSTVLISAARAGNVIRVSVEDSGPGLSESQISHLFDPFWQASKKAGGVGLGLAIAKGIVEAHGGHISVKSVPGNGTTFFFTVPLAKPARDDGDALAAD